MTPTAIAVSGSASRRAAQSVSQSSTRTAEFVHDRARPQRVHLTIRHAVGQCPLFAHSGRSRSRPWTPQLGGLLPFRGDACRSAPPPKAVDQPLRLERLSQRNVCARRPSRRETPLFAGSPPRGVGDRIRGEAAAPSCEPWRPALADRGNAPLQVDRRAMLTCSASPNLGPVRAQATSSRRP
jgi:hypothetical protein